MNNISPTIVYFKFRYNENVSSHSGLRRQDVNVAGSEWIPAQKCVRDKKWCHISRRQISNSMTYGWMSVSGVAITRPRKSSREIPDKKHIIKSKWDKKGIRLYLTPYRKFGMPVAWRIWTRNFPSTWPCVPDDSTASQHIRLSLQTEPSLFVYILQMAVRAAFQPRQQRAQDIHASRALVWR